MRHPKFLDLRFNLSDEQASVDYTLLLSNPMNTTNTLPIAAPEDYLFELPDYISGVASPEVAMAIERLLQTDTAFRLEYETMKLTMAEVSSLSAVYLEQGKLAEATPRYFVNFSVRINEKLAASPKTLWDHIADLLIPRSSLSFAELGTACAGFVLMISIVGFLATREVNLSPAEQFIVQSDKASNNLREDTGLTLATLQYASGVSAETATISLSDEDAEKFFRKLNAELPAESSPYRVLSDDEARSILESL